MLARIIACLQPFRRAPEPPKPSLADDPIWREADRRWRLARARHGRANEAWRAKYDRVHQLLMGSVGR